MAFTALRNKRNARWSQKLRDIFQDWDKNHSGSISVEQMSEIYRIYKVELNMDDIKSKVDSDGQIKKADFVEFSLNAQLLDLTESTTTRRTVRRDKSKPRINKEKEENKKEMCSQQKFTEDINQVEAAFRKFDIDQDGFIDWDEFKHVANNLKTEQARRIFDTCDQTGDKKISLEEFKSMANMKTS